MPINKIKFLKDIEAPSIVTDDLVANSLKLGNNAKIPAENIEGIDNYVTFDQLGDISGEGSSEVTMATLAAYLKTSELGAKLDNLNVAYRGDVQTTQETIDEESGLVKTTSTYVGADGKTYTAVTYTTKDGDYVLLNRDNTWGSGDSLVKISKEGLLEANNAVITGTVYATDGKFTGTVEGSTIKGGTLEIGSDDGATSANIDENGKLTATGANITGDITATSLKLGSGVKISTDDITGLDQYAKLGDLDGVEVIIPDNVITTDKVTISETTTENGTTVQTIKVGEKEYTSIVDGDFIYTDIGLGTNTDDSSQAYFKIDKNGLMTAKNAIVYGTVYATAGKFTGDIEANSLKLGNNVKLDATKDIDGLSSVATSGNYDDLADKPDLSGYATTDSLNEYATKTQLTEYAKSDDLAEYLKSDDIDATLDTKLGELNVYRGNVQVDESIEDGIKTITTTYTDADGNESTFTTYTTEDGKYVLLNKQCGESEEQFVKIEEDGLLTAKNAVIYGEIHAAKGELANWRIGTDELSSSTGSVGLSAGNGHTQASLVSDGESPVRFYAGKTVANEEEVDVELEIMIPGVGPWTASHTFIDCDEIELVSGSWLALDENHSGTEVDLESFAFTSNVSIDGTTISVTADYGYFQDISKLIYTATVRKISYKNNLTILDDGSLYANAADISGKIIATEGEFNGKITATEGEIASFVIDDKALYNKHTVTVKDAGITTDYYMTAPNEISSTSIYRMTDSESDFSYVGKDGIGTMKFTSLDGGNNSDAYILNSYMSNGKLYSNSAEITGKITADSGKIANFVINQNALYNSYSYKSGSSTFDFYMTAPNEFKEVALDTIASAPDKYIYYMRDSESELSYVGGNGIGTVKFTSLDGGQNSDAKVSNSYMAAGKLYSNNAEITGKITATEGTFKGTVNATSGDFDSVNFKTGTIGGIQVVPKAICNNAAGVSVANWGISASDVYCGYNEIPRASDGKLKLDADTAKSPINFFSGSTGLSAIATANATNTNFYVTASGLVNAKNILCNDGIIALHTSSYDSYLNAGQLVIYDRGSSSARAGSKATFSIRAINWDVKLADGTTKTSSITANTGSGAMSLTGDWRASNQLYVCMTNESCNDGGDTPASVYSKKTYGSILDNTASTPYVDVAKELALLRLYTLSLRQEIDYLKNLNK